MDSRGVGTVLLMVECLTLVHDGYRYLFGSGIELITLGVIRAHLTLLDVGQEFARQWTVELMSFIQKHKLLYNASPVF